MKFILTLAFFFSLSHMVYAQSHNHASKSHDHKYATQMDKVLKSNDDLFITLLGNDQSKVEEAARNLEKTLNSASYANLSKLVTGLSAISKSNSKDKNIEAYSRFMPGLIEQFKNQNINTNYAIYYCPMVKKYWLQNIKKTPKVQNVFAQEMLECGGKI